MPGRYTGVSEKNNYQEALNDAVEQADKNIGGAYKFKIVEAEGSRGGFVGETKLEVTIEIIQS